MNKGWKYEFQNEILLYSGDMDFCCALPVMMGCMGETQKSRKDSFEVLYQQMEQVSVDSPEQVTRMVDSILPSVKDSMMYYRMLF